MSENNTDGYTDATYRCRECDWTGDDYELVNDGSVGGTAVCPVCGGGLRL